MLKYLILPVGILMLVSCGNEEPEAETSDGEEETDVVEVTEEQTEEQTEEPTEEATEAQTVETAEEESAEEDLDETDLGSSDESLVDSFEDNEADTEGETSGGEGESINEVFEASEPNDDLVFDDILTSADNVDNYMTDSRVYLEIYDQGQVVDQNFIGITSEVSEGEQLKVASDMMDQDLNTLDPYGYTNEDTGEFLLYENGSWVDYSNELESEELVYGLYSRIDEVVRSMEDSFETREHEDYNVLHYQGDDDEVYEMFEEMFDLEMNDVNLDERRMEVLVYTHKETGEITLVDFRAAAPVNEAPDQELLIEVILSYYEYGGHPPENIREPS